MTRNLVVPLDRAAHGRAGDKGNRLNISVIALHPSLWKVLIEQVTEQRVASQFSHRQPGRIVRYLLPNLHAMNFVIDDALDGGVNEALNLDGHGKTLSFLLLALMVEVPIELGEYLARTGLKDDSEHAVNAPLLNVNMQ